MKWERIEFGKLYLIPSKNGLNRPRRIRGSGYKMINMGELFANDRIKDIEQALNEKYRREQTNLDLRKEKRADYLVINPSIS